MTSCATKIATCVKVEKNVARNEVEGGFKKRP